MLKILVILVSYLISVQTININVDLCETRLEKILNNGHFFANKSIEFEGLMYNEDNYFYYNYTGEGEYVGCPCNFNRCYRKCCPPGQALDENLHCVFMNSDQTLSISIYENEDRIISNLTLEDFVQIEGSTCNSGLVAAITPEKGDFYLQKDGSLYYVIENYGFARNVSDHCVDFMYKKQNLEKVALACIFDEIQEDNNTIRHSYGGIMIFAAPFLLATFLVYVLIPELRETTHGKCIASYAISLFMGSFLIGIIYLFSHELNQKLCVGSAFLSYGSYMASFFWLNVMCIDMLWKFCESYKNVSNTKKNLIYNIYAWGSAILALSIALILQYMDRNLIPPYIVRPEIGIMKCWFADTRIQGYYMYGPLLIIIIINCLLFISTILHICKLKAQMKQPNKIPGHVKFYIKEFSCYLILFFAFGLNWCFELLPWLSGKSFHVYKIFDVINMLYGVFLFILACCNKKVWRLLKSKNSYLKKKFPNKEGDTSAISTGNNYPLDVQVKK